MMVQPDERLPLPHFEDQLWAELSAVHRAAGPHNLGGGHRPTPPRRPWRLVAVAAAVVTALGVMAAALAAGGDSSQTVDMVPADEPSVPTTLDDATAADVRAAAEEHRAAEQAEVAARAAAAEEAEGAAAEEAVP